MASDPTSSAQIRQKRKVYAALAPSLAYYADHVELSDGGLDFASQIGVGGIIGTKFTWPEPNPDAKESGGSLLTPEKEELLRKWVPIYKEKMLSKGLYRGDLYTYGIDKPEITVTELANLYQKAGKEIFGYTGKVKYAVSEDKDYLTNNPQRRCPKIDKAKKALAYNPSIHVDEGVKRFLTFIKESPEENLLW